MQLYSIINTRLFYHVTLRLSIKEMKMKKTALYNPHAGKTKINYTGIAIKGLLFNFKPKNATVTVDGIRHEYKKV